jgi:hypothetical protein
MIRKGTMQKKNAKTLTWKVINTKPTGLTTRDVMEATGLSRVSAHAGLQHHVKEGRLYVQGRHPKRYYPAPTGSKVTPPPVKEVALPGVAKRTLEEFSTTLGMGIGEMVTFADDPKLNAYIIKAFMGKVQKQVK